jgi:vacuolar protein sorting-associated protein VTA1
VTAPSFLPQQPTAPPAPYAPSIASVTSITSSDYQTTGGGGGAPPAKFVPDDVAIAKAQKHARWAISALNFEDVDTAIRELRGALETLGAR